ncbi:hypothetical protein BKA83DRAFT_4123175 [Pisolithus microcarpus]|nr:hypothetical protein BKA83DRAFT_4123175 [Pisolithus microcarpus]
MRDALFKKHSSSVTNGWTGVSRWGHHSHSDSVALGTHKAIIQDLAKVLRLVSNDSTVIAMTCIIPHPGAASAVLKAVNERNHTFYHATGPVKIQVLDKYMAILCYDVVVDDNEFTDYFQLWAWKADKDFKGSSSLCSLTDFTFLEEDRFLLANDGIITVFSFAGDQTLVTPQCTAKLVTPTLTQNWQFADAFLGRNPAPAIGTMTSFPRRWVERGDSSMFHLTADDQLLAFTEFLRLQSLLREESGKQEGSQRPCLPYSIWGRSQVHWFPDHYVDWQNLQSSGREQNICAHLNADDANSSVERDIRSIASGFRLKPKDHPRGRWRSHWEMACREIVAEETLNATEVMIDEGRILLFSVSIVNFMG